MENQDFVDQNGHPALALLAARTDLFARQGNVCASWRRVGPKTYGPYYRLRYREGGASRSLYLGRAGPLVDRVRQALHVLQAPLRQRRALEQLGKCVRDALRVDRRQLDGHLRRLGLRLKGFEVRGWRTSPLGALTRIASPQSRMIESMRPDPCRLPRVRQLRFVPAGGAARWFRENRPKIPRLPHARLEAFLDARDTRRGDCPD